MGIVPPVGRYIITSVCRNNYFVFHDRIAVTNVFPDTMKYKVFRLHPDGVLRAQDVPRLLPAYHQYGRYWYIGIARVLHMRNTNMHRKNSAERLAVKACYYYYSAISLSNNHKNMTRNHR